jgi:hypothetical protein
MLPLINPQSINLLLLLWGSMVRGVINVSTGGSVGGSILLPNALQVELSSIGENNGGIDGLVGLLLGLSLYVSSNYADRERREREGTYSFLDLGPIGLLVLFVGRQLFGGRHLLVS